MHCEIHGDLPADWQSCPYCLREVRKPGNDSVPPPPRAFNAYASPAAAMPPANATRVQASGSAPGGADQTRGGPGFGRYGAADVTHGADGDVRGYAASFAPAAGQTRIIDVPDNARRKVRAWLIQRTATAAGRGGSFVSIVRLHHYYHVGVAHLPALQGGHYFGIILEIRR